MKIRPGISVIMCGGHSHIINEASEKNIGVMEYISKPYHLKELSIIALNYIK